MLPTLDSHWKWKQLPMPCSDHIQLLHPLLPFTSPQVFLHHLITSLPYRWVQEAKDLLLTLSSEKLFLSGGLSYSGVVCLRAPLMPRLHRLGETKLVLANTSTIILQSSIHSNIHLFIYSRKKQLLNDYHMPSTVRSTGHKGVTRLYLYLQGLHFFFTVQKQKVRP